ncbi:MAG: hypothetical protein PF545_07480, partial [Elusimicrobia bacterium]|nr:hypothetical protein [Elusimicrobiota bacterium]
TFGNIAESFASTVTFTSQCPDKTLPADYIFSSSGDQGSHTFAADENKGVTFSSANVGGWNLHSEDLNDPSVSGDKSNIYVLEKPVSSIGHPSNSLHTNSINLSSGTVSVHSQTYADISDVEIRMNAVTGPEAGNDFDGSVWVAPSEWLTAGFSNSAGTWTYTNMPTWSSIIDSNGGVELRIYSKVYDTLYGTQTGSSYNTLYYDSGKPESTIDAPISGNHDSITLIQGTSWDPGDWSSISRTDIAIKVIATGTTYYWKYDAYPSSGDWQDTQSAIWKSRPGGTNWNWDSSNVTWKEQMQHTIYSKAVDAAGNAEAPVTATNITYDTNKPDSAITTPADTDIKNSVTSIEGTSSDGQGIKYVKVYLQKDPGAAIPEAGYYYDWSVSAWAAAPGDSKWKGVSPDDSYWGDLTEDWTVSVGTPWEEEIDYYIRSRSSDTAGNLQDSFNDTVFTYDITAPTSTVVDPLTGDDKNWDIANWNSDEKNVMGTAMDVNGINNVELMVKRESGYYWDGGGWESDITVVDWITPSTSDNYQNWKTTGIAWASGERHLVWMRIVDEATNKTVYSSEDVTPNTGEIENNNNWIMRFRYDKSTPTVSVTEPVKGEYLNYKKSTFTGTSVDFDNSGVSYVKLRIKRNDGDYWQGISWGASAVERPVTGILDWEFSEPNDYPNTFYENSEDYYEIESKVVD